MKSTPPNHAALALQELHKGTVRHRAGELGLAQSHYLRAVKLDESNADAWHLLGVAALQTGNPQLAAKRLKTCLQHRPEHAEAHNNLGVALRRLGRHEEALGAFQGALAAREHYVEAAYNLGLEFEALGDDAGAARAYEDALQWRGTYVDAATNLGNLRRRQDRYAEALVLLELAQKLAPDSAQTNGNLALVLIDLERFADADRAARAAVAIEPQAAQWWRAAGVAQRLHRDLENAIASLRKAVELDPKDGTALFELGLALQDVGAIEDARAAYARTPASSQFAERLRWTNALSLPVIYADEAAIDVERNRFASGLQQISRGLRLATFGEIRAAYDAACGFAPFPLHYQPRDNTALQCEYGDLVARISAAAAPDLAVPCPWRMRARGSRLRIGVISSHLHEHSVMRFFKNLLAGLDRERFELQVWSGSARRDAITTEIANRADHFIEAGGEALEIARQVRAAELDVLIYPEIGMDPRHQVLASLRLAPVQCVLYGHPATSGLANVDYFVSAQALEPEQAEGHYRERLVRLPGIGARPQCPPPAGDSSWYDDAAHGAPVVLCLQNLIKLVPSFDRVLARIAGASGARIGLITRNPPLTQRYRSRIERAFTDEGVDPARHLVFFSAQNHADYLAGVKRAPLVLDSPWFSGGSTSLDALAVGTPVLTLEGAMARGRQTAGMLRVMGIDDLVTIDESDYVDRAIALIGNGDERNALSEMIGQQQRMIFEDSSVAGAFEAFLDTLSAEQAA